MRERRPPPDLPPCCPACMGRLLYQRPPPGMLAAACKGCAALVLTVAPYPLPAFPRSP